MALVTQEIAKICSRAAVPEELIQYMTADAPAGLGMKSLSDYANFFTESDAKYETEMQTAVLDKAAEGKFKDDPLARSRLRTSWRLAKAEFEKACTKMVSDDIQVDYDAPLPVEDERKRKEDFSRAYDDFSTASEHTPMRALVSRNVREFRSDDRHVSLTDTRRVRSEAQIKLVQHRATTHLGPQTSLVTAGREPSPAAKEHADVGAFLEAHRLICLS